MDKTLKSTAHNVDNSDHAEGVAQYVCNGMENARHRIVDGYGKVSKKAHDAWDNVADKNINDVTCSVQTYVRDHPGKCLLLAAGAGLALGLALRCRRGWRMSK